MKPRLKWWEIVGGIITYPLIVVGGIILVGLILLLGPDDEPLPPEF